MADTCAKCGRPRYPDARTYCERCSPFRADRFTADDAMLPLVAGGQGRHPEDVTDAAMALRDLALMLAGGIGALLIVWMVWRAVA